MPCRAVGGDFFDYVDLPTGQFGFIVGDVAGKGSPAALLAAAVLGMFSAEATYQAGAAPLMTRLNRGLFRRAIEARFLTSFYGMLAPDGSLTYCNAGHNAPMLVDERRHPPARNRRRRARPVRARRRSSEETVQLEPGDLIVAVQRRRHRGDERGERRVHRRSAARRAPTAHRGQTPQEVLDALLADVHAFCAGATQSDDVTVVIVRYNGA